MLTAIQEILETWQYELRWLLDKTSSRITSQEHTKRIPHANHCYRKATNRTTTTTKGSTRSMKIRWFSMIVTNSAHDTGVVSEGERREIAHRNRWCDFRPATARIKPSKRHIGRPKPAICEANVSAATMTDILESSYRRTQSQPIGGSTWCLPERICVRCCVQHQAYNLLNCAAGNRLLVAIG